MNRRFRRPIRIFLAAVVVFAICMIGVPATATPIAAQFFVPTDFSASLTIVLQTVPIESRETIGTNVSDSLSREVTTGPPGVGSDIKVSIGGAAGLDLGAFGGAEVVARAKPDTGEEVLGYGEVRAGVMNKFIAVPRSGFSGTEAFIQFDVLTQGLLFADLFDSNNAAFTGGSSVVAGVSLNVPGWCSGCLGDYYFEDVVSLGYPQHGVFDRYRFEGYIPVGVPVIMDAGLTISTGMHPVASFPDGFFSGKTGAYFQNTLRFGVSSLDPVDFVWASDLYFDRQPSVSDQVPVPEPATGVLLLSGLIGLVGYGRKKLLTTDVLGSTVNKYTRKNTIAKRKGGKDNETETIIERRNDDGNQVVSSCCRRYGVQHRVARASHNMGRARLGGKVSKCRAPQGY